MKRQLLLLQDVYNLGRKGEIVTARPGYVRNFLLPQEKAVIATKQTLKIREKLQKERALQAAVDKKDAEQLAELIKGKTLKITVKTDPAGHLYGSVGVKEIVRLFEEEGMVIERHHVKLPRPIKKSGNYTVDLVLNEGVSAAIALQVIGETEVHLPIEETPPPSAEEVPPAESEA